MSYQASLMAIALAGVTFAGCIGDGDVGTDDALGLIDLTTVIDLLHDVEDGHANASLHQKASANMEFLGFNDLAGDDAYNDGNAEVTYHDGYAYVATLGNTSGFAIVDVADPSDPKVVGKYRNPNVYSPDIKVTWDGKYALLSSHPQSTLATHAPALAAVPSRITDPTAYQEKDHVTGVTLVDISDKTAPRFVDFYAAEPNGVHNTEYAKIGDRHVVFTVDRNHVGVLEIRDTAQGTKLVPIATIMSDDDWRDGLPGTVGATEPGAYLPSGSHDVVYQVHPVTGEHLVYIAFGRAGFYIYKVDDPTRPSQYARWDGLPAPSNGYYHYAAPLPVMVDERHITVVAPEIYNAAEDEGTGTFAILDTTNPREPQQIGAWVLPGDGLFIEKNYRFSPHNFHFDETGKMFVGNYHAGVWVLDLACKGCTEKPQVDGFFLPSIDPGRPVCAFWCERPFVWGVDTDGEGTLFASDVESGLYVIRYRPTGGGAFTMSVPLTVSGGEDAEHVH